MNEKHYHGKPCKKCGGTLRWVKHRSCVPCSREQSKLCKRQGDYSAYNRRWYLNEKYGITQEGYDEMLRAQNGRCAICQEPMGVPHIDHNHVTGAIRALLCGPCNQTLGLMKEEPHRLRAAADYLERHNGRQATCGAAKAA